MRLYSTPKLSIFVLQSSFFALRPWMGFWVIWGARVLWLGQKNGAPFRALRQLLFLTLSAASASTSLTAAPPSGSCTSPLTSPASWSSTSPLYLAAPCGGFSPLGRTAPCGGFSPLGRAASCCGFSLLSRAAASGRLLTACGLTARRGLALIGGIPALHSGVLRCDAFLLGCVILTRRCFPCGGLPTCGRPLR